MKYLLLLMALPALMTACSGSSNPVDLPLPTIPDSPIKSEEDTLKPQSAPINVPAVAANQTYHGLLEGTWGEPIEFTMEEGGDEWVIDIEYTGDANIEVGFNDFSTGTFGSCDLGNQTTEWLTVDSDGVILDGEKLGMFDRWMISDGERYILRLTHRATTECKTITRKVTIQP